MSRHGVIQRRFPLWPIQVEQDFNGASKAGRIDERLPLPICELSLPRVEFFQCRRVGDVDLVNESATRDHDQVRRTLAVGEMYGSKKNEENKNTN
jgi:hypothetical protein